MHNTWSLCKGGESVKTDYQYLVFVKRENPTGKTFIFECKNKRSNTCLGIVRWYGSWRQYCYLPEMFLGAVYSSGCLDDISNFVKQLNDAQKRG
jgi:hypothetical protein